MPVAFWIQTFHFMSTEKEIILMSRDPIQEGQSRARGPVAQASRLPGPFPHLANKDKPDSENYFM